MTSLPTTRLSRHFLTYFSERTAERKPFAIVSVLSTEGSSYSKAGHQLLVDADGRLQGLLSGGCLESDLAERVRRVIETKSATVVEYDLRDDDDVFGMGVGCDGVIRILIQPLLAETEYEPLASVLEELEHTRAANLRLDYPGIDAQTVKFVRPAHVLVLGAGPDAEPLLQICDSMGWQLVVNDHRQAYVSNLKRPDGCVVECAPAEDVAAVFDLSRIDAVIVMSHSLGADRAYLRVLAASNIEFVGLLGPPHRRDRLLGEMGTSGDGLAERLRSPVGRQIGGRGPEAIALEVAVELQAYFCGLNGD